MNEIDKDGTVVHLSDQTIPGCSGEVPTKKTMEESEAAGPGREFLEKIIPKDTFEKIGSIGDTETIEIDVHVNLPVVLAVRIGIAFTLFFYRQWIRKSEGRFIKPYAMGSTTIYQARPKERQS